MSSQNELFGMESLQCFEIPSQERRSSSEMKRCTGQVKVAKYRSVSMTTEH